MNNLPEYNSIFRLIPDEDYLKISVIESSSEGIKRRYLSRFVILKCWEKYKGSGDNQQAFDFFLSIMILITAEPSHRRVIKRKIALNTRNIELDVKTVRYYLMSAMEKNKKDDPISIRSLNCILEDAFVDLRKKLGFPEKDCFEYFYEITDELVASVEPGPCKDFLMQQQSNGVFFSDGLQMIQDSLKKECSSDHEAIISALEKNKSTEHLSAISINTEEEEVFVHIVNPDGKHIKMEGWKFLLLIDPGKTPRLLYDFGKSSFRDPPPLFLFNNCKEGKVVGIFHPESSLIHISCFIKNPNDPKDNARFRIDMNYCLCLYTILRKLKDDKVRFTRLREQAEINVEDVGIFEGLFKG